MEHVKLSNKQMPFDFLFFFFEWRRKTLKHCHSQGGLAAKKKKKEMRKVKSTAIITDRWVDSFSFFQA